MVVEELRKKGGDREAIKLEKKRVGCQTPPSRLGPDSTHLCPTPGPSKSFYFLNPTPNPKLEFGYLKSSSF